MVAFLCQDSDKAMTSGLAEFSKAVNNDVNMHETKAFMVTEVNKCGIGVELGAWVNPLHHQRNREGLGRL